MKKVILLILALGCCVCLCIVSVIFLPKLSTQLTLNTFNNDDRYFIGNVNSSKQITVFIAQFNGYIMRDKNDLYAYLIDKAKSNEIGLRLVFVYNGLALGDQDPMYMITCAAEQNKTFELFEKISNMAKDKTYIGINSYYDFMKDGFKEFQEILDINKYNACMTESLQILPRGIGKFHLYQTFPYGRDINIEFAPLDRSSSAEVILRLNNDPSTDIILPTRDYREPLEVAKEKYSI